MATEEEAGDHKVVGAVADAVSSLWKGSWRPACWLKGGCQVGCSHVWWYAVGLGGVGG
jgi:hypothetical protein